MGETAAKTMNNIFAIGDIHGCMHKLRILMDRLDIDFEKDTLVFLGDYIDRGAQSFQVVSYLIELKSRYDNIVFLKGNHEAMLEKYLSGEDRLAYLINGGQQTIDSYMAATRVSSGHWLPDDHLQFFQSLQLYYVSEDYIFVHAGLRDDLPIGQQTSEDLLWIRSRFIKSQADFGKKVIFGHTPVPEPLMQENKIGIDTGAVYGNKLTCVKLPDTVFYSV